MKCRCSCVCDTEVSPARITAENGGPRCMVCELAQHFDSAKRAADQVKLHLLADREQAIGSWVAIRLSDGGSDGVLYPSKHIAVRYQLNEFLCAYVRIPPTGMSPREAEVFLRFNRMLYNNGWRMADPDKDLEVIMPLNVEEHF